MASATEISRLDYIEKAKLEKLLSLVDLDSDVLSILINEPEDGQTLVYEATSGKWKNKEVSGGGLFVTITDDESDGYTADKTFDEISTAILAGKNVFLVEDDLITVYTLNEFNQDVEEGFVSFGAQPYMDSFSDYLTIERAQIIIYANNVIDKYTEKQNVAMYTDPIVG